jgi:hypothetical protein
VLLISTGAIEGQFVGKMLQEGHLGGLVLPQQCSVSPGTCNPEETGLPGFPISIVQSGWMDNLTIFFFLSGLQKLEQWAKKCIELRGECVE